MSTPALQHVRIYRDYHANAWMIDHQSDPSAADVYALFGTYTLPLPFTAHADEPRVRAALQRLNPGIVIDRGQDVDNPGSRIVRATRIDATPDRTS